MNSNSEGVFFKLAEKHLSGVGKNVKKVAVNYLASVLETTATELTESPNWNKDWDLAQLLKIQYTGKQPTYIRFEYQR